MNKNHKWMALGALLCALYVLLGAFGAHGLENTLDTSSLATYETALRYLIIHGISLIIINFIAIQWSQNFSIVNILLCSGIVLFSFSLLIHSCKELLGIDYNFFALIAPIGGIAYVTAWIALSIKFIRQ